MPKRAKTTARMAELLRRLSPQERKALARIIGPFSGRKGDVGEMVDAERGKPVCPSCGREMSKNGTDRSGNRKWACSKCRVYASSTGSSVARHCRISAMQVICGIGCAVSGMTVKDTAYYCGVGGKSAFYLRAKIDAAISEAAESVTLGGSVQLDGVYFDVVLKGTRKDKMPRESRQRGGKKGAGLDGGCVCALVGVDENDHFVAKVSGLGQETRAMVDAFSPRLSGVRELVTDMKACYEGFCRDNGIAHVAIKSTAHTDGSGKSLADLNGFVSEVRGAMYGRRTVSTRHLQAHLDRICVVKMLSYTYSREDVELELLGSVLAQKIRASLKGIFEAAMPVDLRELYGDLALLVDPNCGKKK